jgi:hypothetical protein
LMGNNILLAPYWFSLLDFKSNSEIWGEF